MKNYKKILAVCFLVSFLFLTFLPSAMAASPWKTIVPCGRGTANMCKLCHLIVGINNLVFDAFLIFVGVALLMLVVAGIMYIVSAGNTTMMESAKKLMKNVLAGFALVLLAWLIVDVTMLIIGAQKPGLGVGATNWYTFSCNTTSSAK